MIQMYPLNLVVSNNEAFSRAYNSNETSIFMTSQCFDEGKLASMLEQGAKFNSIICVDGEGDEIVESLKANNEWDSEIQPCIQQYNVSPNKTINQLVQELHAIFTSTAILEGMG
jgi:hypothetical protein